MNCALYRRVSTDHQDGSLEVQEKRVLDYARFKDLIAPEEYTFSDPDTSGSIPLLERPGGRALMNRLQQGEVKHLIVAKLDRLGRNTRDFLTTLETLDRWGITLHIADFGGDSISTQGHWGRMILTILAAVAEAELGEIRDRTRKRMRHKFDKGELCGTVPFGYDAEYTLADGTTFTSPRALSAAELTGRGTVTGKRVLANPREQTVLLQMQQWRAAGCKLEDIAAQLNTAGVKAKQGGHWQAGNVDKVIRSRHARRLILQSTAACPQIAPIPADL